MNNYQNKQKKLREKKNEKEKKAIIDIMPERKEEKNLVDYIKENKSPFESSSNVFAEPGYGFRNSDKGGSSDF